MKSFLRNLWLLALILWIVTILGACKKDAPIQAESPTGEYDLRFGFEADESVDRIVVLASPDGSNSTFVQKGHAFTEPGKSIYLLPIKEPKGTLMYYKLVALHSNGQQTVSWVKSLKH